MKQQLLTIFLLSALWLIACHKSVKLSAPPEGLQQSVKEFVAVKGEVPGGLRVFSDPNIADVFLVLFDTDKSDGCGLIAQREEKAGQTYWRLSLPTVEQLNNFDF